MITLSKLYTLFHWSTVGLVILFVLFALVVVIVLAKIFKSDLEQED